MKAVIMAGGEGVRLRPLTCHTPKPMVRLFDRPVMEYILRLLRQQGFRDIAATLAYRPEVIEDHFGDGSELGLRLRYYREERPLGTAGSVGQCTDFVDGDFLVISGDCICDFDLGPALALHRERDADATLVLYRHPAPLDYGLVLTGDDGRVIRFIEKPAWEQVFTDTVNTGIYIINPRILPRIPSGRPFDFSNDLFPGLLRDGRLYACVLSGYWCDIGDCDAFLQCAVDAMDGKINLDAMGLSELDFSPSPAAFPGAVLRGPCYAGRHVKLLPGAEVGPYGVLGEGSVVGCGATVERTLCDGAHLADGAAVYGAILCRNARVGEHAVVEESAVIGEGAVIGDQSVVHAGVRVWPDQRLGEGARLRFNLMHGARAEDFRISERGILRGLPNVDLQAEDCLALGAALGTLAGAGGLVGLGCDGSQSAAMLLSAAQAGLQSAGAVPQRHDARFTACASFVTTLARQEYGMFIRAYDAGVQIALFDSLGLPPDRKTRRKIEGMLRRRDYRRADSSELEQAPEPLVYRESRGTEGLLSGMETLYAAAAQGPWAAQGPPEASPRLWVTGDNPTARTLRDIFRRMGAAVEPGAFLVWEPGPDGLTLGAVDENGEYWDDAHTMAMAALCALKTHDSLVLSAEAPAALESLAAEWGCEILRPNRPALLRRWAADRFLWDGLYRAAWLTAQLAREGMTLAELAAGLPRFCTRSREFSLQGDRSSFMEALLHSLRVRDGAAEETEAPSASSDAGAEAGAGLQVALQGCHVRVRPSGERRAVRVTVEGANEEIAMELCDFFESRVRQLDGGAKRSGGPAAQG